MTANDLRSYVRDIAHMGMELDMLLSETPAGTVPDLELVMARSDLEDLANRLRDVAERLSSFCVPVPVQIGHPGEAALTAAKAAG